MLPGYASFSLIKKNLKIATFRNKDLVWMIFPFFFAELLPRRTTSETQRRETETETKADF